MAGLRRLTPALLIALTLTGTALAGQQSDRVAPVQRDTLHGHGHRVAEVRMVAKKGWRLAHGPTKRQVTRYRHALHRPLPDTRGQMHVVWQRQRDRYEDLRQQRRRKLACGYDNVLPCITYAAVKYGQSVSKAKAVAYAESTYNPYASNGSHFGLWQFDSATWSYAIDVCGLRAVSAYNPYWSSLGAMCLWRLGQQSRWVTYRIDDPRVPAVQRWLARTLG